MSIRITIEFFGGAFSLIDVLELAPEFNEEKPKGIKENIISNQNKLCVHTVHHNH